eukprot:3801982-Rhodomonas_salina.1
MLEGSSLPAAKIASTTKAGFARAVTNVSAPEPEPRSRVLIAMLPHSSAACLSLTLSPRLNPDPDPRSGRVHESVRQHDWPDGPELAVSRSNLSLSEASTVGRPWQRAWRRGGGA